MIPESALYPPHPRYSVACSKVEFFYKKPSRNILDTTLESIYLIGKVKHMQLEEIKKCFKCNGELKESGILFAGGEKEYICTICGTSQT